MLVHNRNRQPPVITWGWLAWGIVTDAGKPLDLIEGCGVEQG